MTERKKSEENARRVVEEATARRVAEDNARLIQEQRERLHVTDDRRLMGAGLYSYATPAASMLDR